VETFAEFAIRYKGAMALKDSGYDAFSEAFGLNWRNFFPTIYELAPWSFFIDYFSNLNEIINALAFNTSSLSWLERGVFESSKRIISTSCEAVEPSTDYFWQMYPTADEKIGSITALSKVREPYEGSLVPSFFFEVPGVKQTGNIGALVVSAGGVTNFLKSKVFR
jgi:hypothetical protein